MFNMMLKEMKKHENRGFCALLDAIFTGGTCEGALRRWDALPGEVDNADLIEGDKIVNFDDLNETLATPQYSELAL